MRWSAVFVLVLARLGPSFDGKTYIRAVVVGMIGKPVQRAGKYV